MLQLKFGQNRAITERPAFVMGIVNATPDSFYEGSRGGIERALELIKEGAPNIVCCQPFACLPNHIIGKGVIKKLRTVYPSANITPIDFDPGASEVNQINRIKLMLAAAKENM